jgi:SAM-dependent methyltransferase
VRRAARRIAALPFDAVDVVTLRSEPMIPPRRLRSYVGKGSFGAIGLEFRGYLVDLAQLNPSDRVLDVGCGVGRTAVPLTSYLTDGSYDGLDVAPEAIAWCSDSISSRYPNFRFQVAEVENTAYRPDANGTADEYRFPYRDADFDVAFAISLFTHLLPASANRYIEEIERVLKPGGKVLLTWFLLNDESERGLEQGSADRDFPHRQGPCALATRRIPELAVAYQESFVLGTLERAGLRLERLLPGLWSGRSDGTSYQDLIVAAKPNASR